MVVAGEATAVLVVDASWAMLGNTCIAGAIEIRINAWVSVVCCDNGLLADGRVSEEGSYVPRDEE